MSKVQIITTTIYAILTVAGYGFLFAMMRTDLLPSAGWNEFGAALACIIVGLFGLAGNAVIYR